MPQEYSGNNNTAAISQAGLALTPELIATLVSLLPGKTQSSSLESAKQPAVSPQPPIPPVVSNKGATSEGWMVGHQSSDLTGQPFQQMGNHFNPQGQSLSQFQPYPPLHQTPNQLAPQAIGTSQIQDAAVSLPQQQQVPIPYRPLSTYSAPPENAQASGLALVNSQYQHDVSQISQRGYGSVNGVDTSGYGPPVMQQSTNTVTLSNQGQGSTTQSQPITQLASDRVNPLSFLIRCSICNLRTSALAVGPVMLRQAKTRDIDLHSNLLPIYSSRFSSSSSSSNSKQAGVQEINSEQPFF